MSSLKAKLCSKLIQESFGEIVQQVSDFLTCHGASGLRFVVTGTGLKSEHVKKALCVLIQHNIVYYEESKRGQVNYIVDTDVILLRVRYPQYIYFAKTLYGETGEVLVEEILRNGQLQMSVVIQTVKERLENDDSVTEKVSLHSVREKFSYLARTQFIQRCAVVDPQTDSSAVIPSFQPVSESTMHQLPNVDLEELERRKRKLSEGEESGQPKKKQKLEKPEFSDENIYWKINHQRFDQHLRDQELVNAVARKLDQKAGEVMRTILRLSEVKTGSGSPVTNAVSYNEIFQGMPRELAFSRTSLDQYLKLIVEDSMDFVLKVGESGGGMYAVDFRKAYCTLAKAHIESVVQERFGSKCLRIFRLLSLQKHLEQKQIEEFAMIPSKEAKEMLYNMWSEHFIFLTEVPKTPDYAPARTFYLFSVNLNQVCRMILENTHQAMYNLILRRESETKDHKRILDREELVNAIMDHIEKHGGSEEGEDMLNPSEKDQLAKVHHIQNKLEQSEIQMDNTVFVLKTFLAYEHPKK